MLHRRSRFLIVQTVQYSDLYLPLDWYMYRLLIVLINSQSALFFASGTPERHHLYLTEPHPKAFLSTLFSIISISQSVVLHRADNSVQILLCKYLKLKPQL